MNESAQPERLVRKTNRRFGELQRERLHEIEAFGEYLKHARKAGILPAKVKEPMNLAVALATHCTPCVVRYTRMSLEQGATREERLETALVALGMEGRLSLYADRLHARCR